MASKDPRQSRPLPSYRRTKDLGVGYAENWPSCPQFVVVAETYTNETKTASCSSRPSLSTVRIRLGFGSAETGPPWVPLPPSPTYAIEHGVKAALDIASKSLGGWESCALSRRGLTFQAPVLSSLDELSPCCLTTRTRPLLDTNDGRVCSTGTDSTP